VVKSANQGPLLATTVICGLVSTVTSFSDQVEVKVKMAKFFIVVLETFVGRTSELGTLTKRSN
jgi:hypothetical protein